MLIVDQSHSVACVKGRLCCSIQDSMPGRAADESDDSDEEEARQNHVRVMIDYKVEETREKLPAGARIKAERNMAPSSCPSAGRPWTLGH